MIGKISQNLTPPPWHLTRIAVAQASYRQRVGVLAVQGDFFEHIQILRHLGVETVEVRLPAHLKNIQGLIIPGGESTTIAHMLDTFALRDAIKQHIQTGLAVWGTCAGMILLAKKLSEHRPTPLGLMDIEIARNAFGPQVDSFEADLAIKVLGKPSLRALFIRAPVILTVGSEVQVLARLPDHTPVAVQQGRLLGTAFHPELTDDLRFHTYFLEALVARKAELKA